MLPSNLTMLLFLIIGHLCADFIFQKNSWVEERFNLHWRSPKLYAHVSIHFTINWFIIFLSGSQFWLAIIYAIAISITHLAIDIAKSYSNRDTLGPFILDQSSHFIVLLATWLTLTSQWSLVPQLPGLITPKHLIILTAYILVLYPASVIIQGVCKQWIKNIKDQESLPRGGAWIGKLERTLILTFIFVDQFAAIGFLLAAKSVLRFGDAKEPEHRKINEYILIGTLTSFSITIILGLMVKLLIQKI